MFRTIPPRDSDEEEPRADVSRKRSGELSKKLGLVEDVLKFLHSVLRCFPFPDLNGRYHAFDLSLIHI